MNHQFTLGELTEELKLYDPKKEVQFDFEYAIPTTLDSCRNSYDELALGFEFMGYGEPAGEKGNQKKQPTVKKLLAELVGARGKTFTGWKGGYFIMNKDTPLWVANPGNTTETIIVGVHDDYDLVLKTRHQEDLA